MWQRDLLRCTCAQLPALTVYIEHPFLFLLTLVSSAYFVHFIFRSLNTAHHTFASPIFITHTHNTFWSKAIGWVATVSASDKLQVIQCIFEQILCNCADNSAFGAHNKRSAKCSPTKPMGFSMLLLGQYYTEKQIFIVFSFCVNKSMHCM